LKIGGGWGKKLQVGLTQRLLCHANEFVELEDWKIGRLEDWKMGYRK